MPSRSTDQLFAIRVRSLSAVPLTLARPQPERLQQRAKHPPRYCGLNSNVHLLAHLQLAGRQGVWVPRRAGGGSVLRVPVREQDAGASNRVLSTGRLHLQGDCLILSVRHCTAPSRAHVL